MKINNKTIVFIPGWAFDSRIFSNMAGCSNRMLFENSSPDNFTQRLHDELLQKNITSADFFGWSLGGFLALDFCKQYHNLAGKLYLVSMKTKYSPEELDNEIKLIQKDRRSYLLSFYRNCFAGNRQEFAWFEKTLMRDYLEKFNEEYLLEGLEFLRKQEITTIAIGDLFHFAGAPQFVNVLDQ